MINKNKCSIKATKKVLHKVGKRWVVVSAVLLGLATGGAAANAHVTHAAVNNEPTQVTQNSNGAKHTYHLPQLNSSQANSLQNQAISSTVNNVSSLKNKAVATWDNAWNQKVTNDIDQNNDMAAKMTSLSHLGDYVANDEQQQVSTYGMNSAYGHMPDDQSNADYSNYAAASNDIASDATSLANSMITSMEHDMKIANHARQVANVPIHKQHAQVHSEEVRAATVSVKSASDQANHDAAWAVRNGANDPAKSVKAAQSSAAMAHSEHMSARAHAYKVASHTAMLKRKASNAVVRRAHAAKRSAAETKSTNDQTQHDSAIAKSSADQVRFNAAKSLQAGSNDPAKLNRAKRSAVASQFAKDKAVRAHNRKVFKHAQMIARKKHNDYLRRTGQSKGEIAQRNSQDSKNHRQRIEDQKLQKQHAAVRQHNYKVAKHTAMLKRKASNAAVRKAHAATRSTNQTKSASDQANHDSAWAVRNGANDPAKLAHSNHAKSVSASQALVDKRAATFADQSIATSYSNSVSASVSVANSAKASLAASVANKSLESSIATSYSQSADKSLDDSIATSYATSADDSIATSMITSMDNSISASVSNSVAKSDSASIATSIANSAANAKSSVASAVAAGNYDPNKLSAYQLDNLGTMGYCYDGQGNEYTIPNMINGNGYSFSSKNEIFVKPVNMTTSFDTGVYF